MPDSGFRVQNLQTHAQQKLDYPRLEIAADDRAERHEAARELSAQLAAVPHELVACGPERWDQVRRVLPLLLIHDTASEAACAAGLSVHQFKRVRECIIRRRLATVRHRFSPAGRRIEDQIDIDRGRIAELAAEAREHVRVRCRAPAAQVQRTYSAPVAQVQGTCSAPAAHVQRTPSECGDNARAHAHARVRSDKNDSIDRSIESLSEWGEEEWERVRERVRQVVRRRSFRSGNRRDLTDLVTYAVFIESGIAPEDWFLGTAGDVDSRQGVNAPFRYLRTCLRKSAEEQGIAFHAACDAITPQIPDWVLKPRTQEQETIGAPSQHR